MNLTCYQAINSANRWQYGTNQNFIPRLSNKDVDPTGCKHKSLPKSLNKFNAPTKLKHIYKGRHLSQNRDLRIDAAGGIRNLFLIERVISVPNNQGSPQKFVALFVQLALRQGAAVKVRGHTNHGFQAEDADPSKNSGSHGNGAKSLNCLLLVRIRLFNVSDSRIRWVFLMPQWEQSWRTGLNHQSRNSFAFKMCTSNALSAAAGKCLFLPHWNQSSQQQVIATQTGPGLVCEAPHQALTTQDTWWTQWLRSHPEQLMLEMLAGFEWTQWLFLLLLHNGKVQRDQVMPCGLNWPEWQQSKDPRSSDLKQGNMKQQRGTN